MFTYKHTYLHILPLIFRAKSPSLSFNGYPMILGQVIRSEDILCEDFPYVERMIVTKLWSSQQLGDSLLWKNGG